MAISGHKIGAPAGIGALLVKGHADIVRLIPGGGQEQGRRGGTESAALISAFGAAAEASSYDSAAMAALNLVTFLSYALDKSAAQSGGWRTSEKQLHLLALLGGWPAAWWAQQWLRHKSRKQEFRSMYWATVLLHCAGLGTLVLRPDLLPI